MQKCRNDKDICHHWGYFQWWKEGLERWSDLSKAKGRFMAEPGLPTMSPLSQSWALSPVFLMRTESRVIYSPSTVLGTVPVDWLMHWFPQNKRFEITWQISQVLRKKKSIVFLWLQVQVICSISEVLSSCLQYFSDTHWLVSWVKIYQTEKRRYMRDVTISGNGP